MRVHVIETGWIRWPDGWFRARTSRLTRRLTADTNRRLHRFVEEFPTLLLPSHDAEAELNLSRWEPLRICGPSTRSFGGRSSAPPPSGGAGERSPAGVDRGGAS